MRRDIYSGWVKLKGEEYPETIREANNYASNLLRQQRFNEAKSLWRKVMPVARRVLGEDARLTLVIRWNYAMALCQDTGAALDDLHEAVSTLEDAGRTARRVLGNAHPTTTGIENTLQYARAALRARETPPTSA